MELLEPSSLLQHLNCANLQNVFRASNLQDNRDGHMDEHFAYNLLVEVNFIEWGVGRSLGANGSLPAGLDEMLQPLLDGGLLCHDLVMAINTLA